MQANETFIPLENTLEIEGLKAVAQKNNKLQKTQQRKDIHTIFQDGTIHPNTIQNIFLSAQEALQKTLHSEDNEFLQKHILREAFPDLSFDEISFVPSNVFREKILQTLQPFVPEESQEVIAA